MDGPSTRRHWVQRGRHIDVRNALSTPETHKTGPLCGVVYSIAMETQLMELFFKGHGEPSTSRVTTRTWSRTIEGRRIGSTMVVYCSQVRPFNFHGHFHNLLHIHVPLTRPYQTLVMGVCPRLSGTQIYSPKAKLLVLWIWLPPNDSATPMPGKPSNFLHKHRDSTGGKATLKGVTVTNVTVL